MKRTISFLKHWPYQDQTGPVWFNPLIFRGFSSCGVVDFSVLSWCLPRRSQLSCEKPKLLARRINISTLVVKELKMIQYQSDSGFSVSFGGPSFFGAFHVHWPSLTTTRFTIEKQNCNDASLINYIFFKWLFFVSV